MRVFFIWDFKQLHQLFNHLSLSKVKTNISKNNTTIVEDL